MLFVMLVVGLIGELNLFYGYRVVADSITRRLWSRIPTLYIAFQVPRYLQRPETVWYWCHYLYCIRTRKYIIFLNSFWANLPGLVY